MIFQIDFKFEGLCAATFAPMKENGYVLHALWSYKAQSYIVNSLYKTVLYSTILRVCGIMYLLKPI